MMAMKEKTLTAREVSAKTIINGGVRTLPVLRPYLAPSTSDGFHLALNQYWYVEPLASALWQRDNASVLFNSGTGLGGPNKKADSRLAAIFTSVTSLGAPFSMVGLGRGVLARAGSFLPVRQPYLAPTTLAWRREVGFLHKKEANMPMITRALSRLFPIAHNIGTAANLAEAQALARLHLARTGNAVRIAPAVRGFSVAEVR